MAEENFNRSVIIKFEDRKTGENFEVKGVKITFNVEKQISTEPNVANIEMYNLPNTISSKINFRRDIDKRDFGGKVTIWAGYKTREKTIFTGVIVGAITIKSGTEFITTVSARNIFYVLREKKIEKTVAAGDKKWEVIVSILKGIGATIEERSIEFIKKRLVGKDKKPAVYKKAYTFFGTAGDMIENINAGLLDRIAIYFDDAGVSFNPIGVTIDMPEIKYSPNTGLIGTPEPTERGVNFKTQLDPDLIVNAPIRLTSKTIQAIKSKDGGLYVSRSIRHDGSNRSDGPWESNVVAVYKEYQDRFAG